MNLVHSKSVFDALNVITTPSCQPFRPSVSSYLWQVPKTTAGDRGWSSDNRKMIVQWCSDDFFISVVNVSLVS